MDDRDIRDVAALHIACLDDSLIAALGSSYVESFYRYVASSPKEVLVVERDGDARIVAAAVVTLEPGTFHRRLMWHTPLLRSLLRRAGALAARWWTELQTSRDRAPAKQRHVNAGRPEMILIYTSPGVRGTGRGTALLAAAERKLRERRITEYQARTVLAPSNPALAFYRARSFEPAGVSERMGTRFQVFVRKLDGGGERRPPPRSFKVPE